MNTRHIVHGIAHQNLIVQHQASRYTKLFLHARQVAALAVHGVNDGDVFIHQLSQVFVAAGHNDFNAMRRAHSGQSANHVVGLYTGHIQYLPPHQTHQLMDGFNLRAQIVGHGAAILFVLGVNFVAEGGALGVKHTHRILGGNVFAQALHHVDHASDGTRGRTGRVAGYRPQIGHGMKGTVQIAGAIDQQQGFLVAHAPIVPPQTAFWADLSQQKCHQHPLQSRHEIRHASKHLFHPLDRPLNHGCFYARFRGACGFPPE